MKHETKNFILRKPDLSDLDFFERLYCNAEMMQYIGTPLDPNILPTVIETIQKHWNEFGFGSGIVIHKTSNACIGLAGLSCRRIHNGVLINGGTDCADIGGMLLPEFQKKGLTYVAAQEFLPILFGEWGLKTLFCWPKSTNGASVHLCQKLGLKFREKIDITYKDVKYPNCEYWEISAHDWQKSS